MPRDDQVLYRRLAEDLRRQIRTGELQPGNKLPSERALEGRYRVSRNTVRLALESLINEGLLTSMQGKGYYVREHAPLPYYGLRRETGLRGSSEWQEVFAATVRDHRRDSRTEVQVSLAHEAPPEVAVALEIREGDRVAWRYRTNYVDGDPYAIAISYYPTSLVKNSDIERADDIEPDEVLAELGHRPETYVDRIVSRMPTPEEARLLQLDKGTTVADFVRTGYDASGLPVRIQITTLPGDRFTIVYEVSSD